mmetsp:Transcript_127718/g.272342  ORF Transcript_127718/g.272342 Transcript_127718/m.272342 type:complete len:236 (-) Transcript_127718:2361-3068(-)
MRDKHREARHVWRPERPWHGSTKAPPQGLDPPTHIYIARPVRVRHHTAAPLEEPLDITFRVEDMRHLHPLPGRRSGGGTFRNHTVIVSLATGLGATAHQRLVEMLPTDMMFSIPSLKAQIPHKVVVDFVLIAHVVNDAVPDQGESDREGLMLIRCQLHGCRSVDKHLRREALRDLCNGILEGIGETPATTLHKEDPYSQHGASDGEPELCVREKEKEGATPDNEPKKHVLAPACA